MGLQYTGAMGLLTSISGQCSLKRFFLKALLRPEAHSTFYFSNIPVYILGYCTNRWHNVFFFNSLPKILIKEKVSVFHHKIFVHFFCLLFSASCCYGLSFIFPFSKKAVTNNYCYTVQIIRNLITVPNQVVFLISILENQLYFSLICLFKTDTLWV